jgi:hypothetical protein
MQQRTDELTKAYFSLMTDNEHDEIDEDDAAKKLGFNKETGISKSDGAESEVYRFIAQKMEDYNTGYKIATGNTVLGADDAREFIFTDAQGNKTEGKDAMWVATTLAAA